MKKNVVLVLVVLLLAVVPIAYAGRMCKRGEPCRWKIRNSPVAYTATITATATYTTAPVAPTATPIPTEPVANCDTSYPNSYIAGTCAHATLEGQIATWQAANCAAGHWAGGVLHCSATALPNPTNPAYP